MTGWIAAAWLLSGAAICAEPETSFQVTSNSGRLHVVLAPEDVDEIPIGRFHSWSVRMTDGEGKPVAGARVGVGGGMEGHGHGLPTAPRVVPAGTAGSYRIEGLKFSMAGRWSLALTVGVGDLQESVGVQFDVGPPDEAVELAVLRSLSLHDVEGPPPSPSNRVADDPRAARLGRKIFFDPTFSGNGQVSCASCHQPARYFTDGKVRSRGTGTTLRNAPTVIGSAFLAWFYWDGRRDSLWSQALIPFEAAEEMGSSRAALVGRVRDDADYNRLYRAAFGEAPVAEGPALDRSFVNLGKAIAAYERTLDPPPTRFDRYVTARVEKGEAAASKLLTPDEVAGARLFIDEPRTRCLRCHNGPMLTNNSFHNIGTGNLTGERLDFGRVFGQQAVRIDPFNCLGEFSDAAPEECLELQFLNTEPHVPLEGAFKVPSLRGVSLTAPYMHDGSMATLEEVLAHYRRPPEESENHELTALQLTDAEVAQLVAFLKSLAPGL